ncbi:MAG: RNA polymerase, partial [Firmicutes bacterium]|nr:RNA polymerase [Bacillota bacterium]
MYRIAYIYVRNEADALDVMQEAAYRAFKNRASLKEAKYFRTWLIRITI